MKKWIVFFAGVMTIMTTVATQYVRPQFFRDARAVKVIFRDDGGKGHKQWIGMLYSEVLIIRELC